MKAPTRPVLRYLGGKWRLAPWIVGHFPPHRIYVEPFGGAASVLLRKPPAYAEIYNDLDGDVVNLFRVMRDEPGLGSANRLLELLRLTPFSRSEFDLACLCTDEPIERARRLVVRSFMGHGSNAANLDRSTGFRAVSNRSGRAPAGDWASYPAALEQVLHRIRMDGVALEHRPALEIIRRHDGPQTLIYADPPYVHATRSAKRIKGALYNAYAVELSDDDHVELLEALQACIGMVILSGYPHPIYDERLRGWRRLQVPALADGARDRIEVLWINPAASAAHGLFAA